MCEGAACPGSGIFHATFSAHKQDKDDLSKESYCQPQL